MAVTNNVVHSGTAPDTTLASDITAGSTSITLTSGTGYPSPTGGQIAYITLAPGTAAEELVSYTARSGANLTGVSRGLGGTSASSHTAGVEIRHQWTALESDDVTKTALNTLGRVTAANQLLYSDSATTMAALAVAASRIVGRKSSGDLDDLTAAEVKTILSLASADISDLAEFIRDTMGSALTAGSNVTVTPSDPGDTITIASSATSDITITAPELAAGSGSPSLSALHGSAYVPVWLLDAASQESVGGSFYIPSGWSTINVDLWWTNFGAGSGNVKFARSLNNDGSGETIAPVASSIAATAAPATRVVKVTTLDTGVAVTAGEWCFLDIFREAADVGDTLANDIAILGVRIVKAS